MRQELDIERGQRVRERSKSSREVKEFEILGEKS